MIESIHIQNFKSVVDLKLELGTFNVLIGENGCGKSNILEGIAFGAAAAADKLDYEFLGSRGIRVANPEFMYSAFNGQKNLKKITISLVYPDDSDSDELEFDLKIKNDELNPKRWVLESEVIDFEKANKIIEEFRSDEFRDLSAKLSPISEKYSLVMALWGQSLPNSKIRKITLDELISGFEKSRQHAINKLGFVTFMNFSPEQNSLRRHEESNHIYPLGIRGEGLFQYLKDLAFDKKNNRMLAEIKENLQLLDWYEDFRLPDNLMRNEFSLQIKDRYLDEKLQYFDQRSTNEGFLFLLFYLTLFISKDTPPFFAIDNIDASFNPKMCMQLTKTLVKLAKKHKKQVIVTTHNPAILDGLNLKDDKQRLFVVRRNDDGHTVARRILHRPEREMRLSEAWTNGFIGGLPDNF